MPLIIISHPSTFVSYTLAHCILQTYLVRVPLLKLVVVEHQQVNGGGGLFNKSNHDISPWCGVSMVNNPHFVNKDILNFEFIIDLLKNSGSIYLSRVIPIIPTHQGYNMDKPITNVLEVSIENPLNSSVGLIYHPILLMNNLRFKLFNSGLVSFVSLSPSSKLNILILQISKQYINQEFVVLDFKSNDNARYDSFLINSNLSKLHTTTTNINIVYNFKIPSDILWIPRFKAMTNIPFTNPLYSYQIHHGQDQTKVVQIINQTYHKIRDEIIIHYDLFQSLGICDNLIQILNQILLINRRFKLNL